MCWAVSVGFIPEKSAKCCADIDAIEEGKAVSGTYCLKNNREEAGIPSESYPVNMVEPMFNT